MQAPCTSLLISLAPPADILSCTEIKLWLLQTQISSSVAFYFPHSKRESSARNESQIKENEDIWNEKYVKP